jgi:hypothetical protein
VVWKIKEKGEGRSSIYVLDFVIHFSLLCTGVGEMLISFVFGVLEK